MELLPELDDTGTASLEYHCILYCMLWQTITYMSEFMLTPAVEHWSHTVQAWLHVTDSPHPLLWHWHPGAWQVTEATEGIEWHTVAGGWQFAREVEHIKWEGQLWQQICSFKTKRICNYLILYYLKASAAFYINLKFEVFYFHQSLPWLLYANGCSFGWIWTAVCINLWLWFHSMQLFLNDATFSKHQMENPLHNAWKCSEYNVHWCMETLIAWGVF